MKFEFQVDDVEARRALAGLAAGAGNLRPVLGELGELMVESTKQRFQSSTGPDGLKWKENSQVTKERAAGAFSNRRPGARASRIANKKPLIGESKALSTTIFYRATDDTLEWGSPMEYSATHQFGASKGAFGKTRRNSPIPWGDIPARPFLGLSADDEVTVRDRFNRYLKSTLR